MSSILPDETFGGGRRQPSLASPNGPMTQQSQVISILLLAAEPTDLGRMRLDREFRAVHESLLRARYRDHFEVQQLPAARPPDLRRALLDHRPQVLHFCGHGTGGTGLALEDEHGAARLVSTEVLAELFGLFAPDLRCVVLNACYSEQQAQVILRHIDYVIGMQKEIADTAAIGFSRGFYDALFAGEPVHRAFELGKNAIRLEGPPDAVPSLNARHLLPPSTSTGVIVPDHLKPVILARRCPAFPAGAERALYHSGRNRGTVRGSLPKAHPVGNDPRWGEMDRPA